MGNCGVFVLFSFKIPYDSDLKIRQKCLRSIKGTYSFFHSLTKMFILKNYFLTPVLRHGARDWKPALNHKTESLPLSLAGEGDPEVNWQLPATGIPSQGDLDR